MTNIDVFDTDFYLRENPDVAAVVAQGLTTAFDHFQQHGKFENRAPNELFNPQEYLALNPDVADAVNQGLTTAYDHLIAYGQYEDRDLGFNTDLDYLGDLLTSEIDTIDKIDWLESVEVNPEFGNFSTDAFQQSIANFAINSEPIDINGIGYSGFVNANPYTSENIEIVSQYAEILQAVNGTAGYNSMIDFWDLWA